MLSLRFLAPALFALALGAAPLSASAQSFSDTQRGDIETIVKNYLIAHPEVLEEAMNELSKRQAAADGLVDFRSKLHGRTVLLCWKYGEERVAFFHELDTGFAGRRPLPDDGDFVGDLMH